MKKRLQSAFTLIELLVVITIIAILAGIALPVYSTIQERGQQTKALSQAKQIALALRLYAADNGGSYPSQGDDDPNSDDPNSDETLSGIDADKYLATLVPAYVPNEEIFFVNGSNASTETPDLDETLDPGENHWAYVEGLRDTSSPRIPLLADAMKSVGTWTAVEGDKGGLWKGKKAIVIRVDQSGSIENLDPQTFTLEEKVKGEEKNIFTEGLSVYGSNINVTNPGGFE